jgi:hypothetical protein
MMEEDLTRSPSLGRSMRERRDGPSDSEADSEAEERCEPGDELALGCELETACGRGDGVCEFAVPTIFGVVAARDLPNELEVVVRLQLHVTDCCECFDGGLELLSWKESLSDNYFEACGCIAANNEVGHRSLIGAVR